MSHQPRCKRKQKEAKNAPPSSPPAAVDTRPNQASPTNPESAQPNAEEQTTEPATAQDSPQNRQMIRYTRMIAIATCIYVTVAIWQLVMIAGQLTQMRQDSTLEYRAWIGVSNATHQPIEPNKPAEGKFVFINTGKTPASIVSMGHTTCIRPVGFNVEAFARTQEGTKWVTETPVQKCLAPNGIISWKFSTTKENPLPEDIVTSMKSGKDHLYVIGRIVYHDIFGMEHQTKFCGIAQPDTGKMSMHHTYNYMD